MNDAAINSPLTGCDADLQAVIELLDQAVKQSGLSESTFCQRHLNDRFFRDRLVEGRLNIRTLKERGEKLQQLLSEQ